MGSNRVLPNDCVCPILFSGHCCSNGPIFLEMLSLPMQQLQKVHFSLGYAAIGANVLESGTENVTIIVAYAHYVISASLVGRAQSVSPRLSIAPLLPSDTPATFATSPPRQATLETMSNGVRSSVRSSATPSQPLPFSKVILLSWPPGTSPLSLTLSLDLSVYDPTPTGESYALFLFSNYSSGWLRLPRDRTFTQCARIRTQQSSCQMYANLSNPGAYALISQRDDPGISDATLVKDLSVYDGNTPAVVWGAVCSGLLFLAAAFFCLRMRYRRRHPGFFCAKLASENLEAPKPSACMQSLNCDPCLSAPAKPLPPPPSDAFIHSDIVPIISMIPRPPAAPPPADSQVHRRRTLASLKRLPLPVAHATPSLDSVFAVLDQAQLLDDAAAAAPRPAVVKVTQGIRRKKKKDSSVLAGDEVAHQECVPPAQVQVHDDAGLFIPSLEELGLAADFDSVENCSDVIQPSLPAEVAFDIDQVLAERPSPPPSSAVPVLGQGPPPPPPHPIRSSPELNQRVEQLPEIADGPSGHAVQAIASGKLFSKKKKEKREKRAKAPVPGMREGEEEPEWMTAQKLQQASNRDIPSISSGSGGAALESDFEWAMVRKIEKQKDEEGQQIHPELPSDIPTLPIASSLSSAVIRDSDLGGWKMVRKSVASSPPPQTNPTLQQQHGLPEISDGRGVILGSRDVEGGFFVRKRAGAGKAQGVTDSSMDVEDYDEE
jgi:hypothetical protein